jgi:hypothetical protein
MAITSFQMDFIVQAHRVLTSLHGYLYLPQQIKQSLFRDQTRTEPAETVLPLR